MESDEAVAWIASNIRKAPGVRKAIAKPAPARHGMIKKGLTGRFGSACDTRRDSLEQRATDDRTCGFRIAATAQGAQPRPAAGTFLRHAVSDRKLRRLCAVADMAERCDAARRPPAADRCCRRHFQCTADRNPRAGAAAAWVARADRSGFPLAVARAAAGRGDREHECGVERRRASAAEQWR